MDFFTRYAEVLQQQLNESGSNIGEIAIDWIALAMKENTTATNDTSEAATNKDDPNQDGFMPYQPKRAFKPNESRDDRQRLRDIWKRAHMSSNLEHSEPLELKSLRPGHSARIIRKKVTTVAGKEVRRKAFVHAVK